MAKVNKLSKNLFAAHLDDGRVFFLSNRVSSGDHPGLSSFRQDLHPMTFGSARIVPYGPYNNIPTFIRDVVGENNLVPGVLNRQLGLFWGQGPQLYIPIYEEGRIIQQWTSNDKVMDWLKSWNYEEFLQRCIVDYLHLGGFFCSHHLARGHRIGLPKKVASLEHIPAEDARFEWVDSRDIRDVKRIFVGDFEHRCSNSGVKAYPVYNSADPCKHPVSVSYNHLYSFARKFYSLPQFWGSINWIQRGSEIPMIFKYVTENSINLAYHVHSPESYWFHKADILRKAHPDWDDEKIDDELSTITEKMLASMTDVLAGKENAGKMFHTIDYTDDSGERQSWKIEPIDQKTKDFIEGQLKIEERSTAAITSGMGLHPSLSNIMVNGKLASGSELLYAYKLFLATDTDVATSIITEPINQAIAVNFPDTNVRLGFYHRSVSTEESLSSSQRMKNQ